jgi:hypothetical protein
LSVQIFPSLSESGLSNCIWLAGKSIENALLIFSFFVKKLGTDPLGDGDSTGKAMAKLVWHGMELVELLKQFITCLLG